MFKKTCLSAAKKADVTLSTAVCHTGGPASAGSGLVVDADWPGQSEARLVGTEYQHLSPPLQRQQQPIPLVRYFV